MSYNEENLSKVKHLKDMAERLKAGYATNEALKEVSDKVDTLTAAGGEANVITAVKVNGTALEITDKAVDVGASIAAAVAAAGHLKRVKVDSVDDIDPEAADAEKYIYMVPKTDSDADDLYDEYMVLDGKVEHVGNTKVDLSGYVEAEEGMGLSANDYTDEEKAKLAGLEVAKDIEVQEMLDGVFGAPVSRNFSEIYGMELTSEKTPVKFEFADFDTTLQLNNEATVYTAATSLNKGLRNHGATVSGIDSSTGCLIITDNKSGEEISYTIKINDQVVYPHS